MTAESSLKRSGRVVENHAVFYSGHFNVYKNTQIGNVAAFPFSCDVDKHHSVLWSSSPYLPNGEYLANLRVIHGYECSGMFPVHYNRFSESANIGHINKSKQSYMFSRYKQFIEEEYSDSIETSLMEEIGMNEDLTCIDVMSDVRHSYRTNAKDIRIGAIGEKIHNVLKCEHITKADDVVAQRYEQLGTERIYGNLGQKDENVHSHDRNMSINKKKIHKNGDTINQINSWLDIKAIKP